MGEPTQTRPPLLTIEAARRAIAASALPAAGVETVPLAVARGRILSRAIVSPRALPVFDHSAMDGYALALEAGRARYTVAGRLTAGGAPAPPLAPGQALRIFTGAPLPAGAAAVAMQENAVARGGEIELLRVPAPGDNIRRAGEDVAAGELLAPAGAALDARHIGLAAAAGLETLDVVRKLRVALISTGDELAEAGGRLGPGMIFDSNRPMLLAAMERPALDIKDFGILRDDRAAITAFFASAGRDFDLIVTTGGASAGDEDHLAAALVEAGGAVHTASAAIRPGKPFTYGRIAGASVAILPGNPFAALVAALLFVRPMIARGLGLPDEAFTPAPALAGFDQARPLDRTEFLPARVSGRGGAGLPVIERLGRGGSARLKPLIAADGLAVIAPGGLAVERGGAIGYLPFGAAFSL